VFFGALYEIGGQGNGGFSLITLAQGILSIVVFSFICWRVYLMRMSARDYWVSLGFYAICPLWVLSALFIEKGTLYFIFFALAVCLLAEMYIKRKTGWQVWLFSVSLLLFCLMRKEGIFVAAGMTAVLVVALAGQREKLKGLAAGVAGMLLVFVTQSILSGMFYNPDVNQNRSNFHAYSHLVQQTARTVRDYHDLTPGEEDAIKTTFYWLSEDDPYKIGEVYTPENFDPTKTYMYEVKDKGLYLKTWLSMLVRHPDSYAQASLNQTYGYYYPFFKASGFGGLLFAEPNGFGSRDRDDYSSQLLSIVDSTHFSQSANKRTAIQTWTTSIWRDMPVLSFVISPGVYTWVLAIAITVLLRKRRFRAAAVFVAPVLILVFCELSGMNGSWRIYASIAAAMPLLLSFTLRELNHVAQLHQTSEPHEPGNE
jgi:hypothetical protein